MTSFSPLHNTIHYLLHCTHLSNKATVNISGWPQPIPLHHKVIIPIKQSTQVPKSNPAYSAQIPNCFPFTPPKPFLYPDLPPLLPQDSTLFPPLHKTDTRFLQASPHRPPPPKLPPGLHTNLRYSWEGFHTSRLKVGHQFRGRLRRARRRIRQVIGVQEKYKLKTNTTPELKDGLL